MKWVQTKYGTPHSRWTRKLHVMRTRSFTWCHYSGPHPITQTRAGRKDNTGRCASCKKMLGLS